MGLPNLTPEEEYLLKKFALLKRKVDFGFVLLLRFILCFSLPHSGFSLTFEVEAKGTGL